jgi:hypothetical protein
MKITENGPEHAFGDRNCQTCAEVNGRRYPQLHRDVTPLRNDPGMKKCLGLGLVHCEEIMGKTGVPNTHWEIIEFCEQCGRLG